jgi:hypothetical protein
VDLPAAISQCGYELSEILGKIWGLCRRTNAMFAQFPKEYIVQGRYARQDKIQENGFALSLTNSFGALGGFDKIINLMKGQETGLQFPLSVTSMFLSQFKLLQHYAEKTFVERFASDMSNTLMDRLDNITDGELKEIDKEVPKRIIAVIESFVTVKQPNTKAYEISETYELIFAKKYLTSSFFEKRIRGMAEFKDIFAKVQTSNNHTEKQIKDNDLKHTKYLTYPKFSEWLHRNQILEFIFIQNPHHEIIKRSLELLYLRAIDTTYPLDSTLIKGIWDCCTKKHEEI